MCPGADRRRAHGRDVGQWWIWDLLHTRLSRYNVVAAPPLHKWADCASFARLQHHLPQVPVPPTILPLLPHMSTLLPRFMQPITFVPLSLLPLAPCPTAADGSLRPEFENDCPEPYRRLAERCWHQDPE